MTPLALDAAQVTKSFGGVKALRGVDLTLRRGEIHALLGENGSGKSTIIKVLAGVHRPDGGKVAVGGAELAAGFGPSDVAAAGLRFVHQDLGLVDTLSIWENIALETGFATRYGIIDDRASKARASELLATLGAALHPDMPVGMLSQADKTIVALARAMDSEARLIVLDEVTASLPSPDVARIHDVVRTARDRGTAFLYVTHRLEEVFSLCDRLTVLQDGRNVAGTTIGETDMGEVVRWITGRAVPSGRSGDAAPPRGPVRLGAAGLGGREITHPVSLTLHAGEILGVTGIRGSGYDRLCHWLAGLEPAISGEVRMDGSRLTGEPRQARALGIETVLGDRSLAAFPELTVRENLLPLGLREGIRAERALVARLLEQFDVRPRGADEREMLALSGGNQQKVVFARALNLRPRAIVLIDPTAGIDIGARHELHNLIRRAARDGAALLFGSSDFEEVAEIADRAIVVRKGAPAIEIDGGQLDWTRLLHAAQDTGAATLTA